MAGVSTWEGLTGTVVVLGLATISPPCLLLSVLGSTFASRFYIHLGYLRNLILQGLLSRFLVLHPHLSFVHEGIDFLDELVVGTPFVTDSVVDFALVGLDIPDDLKCWDLGRCYGFGMKSLDASSMLDCRYLTLCSSYSFQHSSLNLGYAHIQKIHGCYHISRRMSP
ncbi:hypothetical protein GQ457_01G021050 [Hibiscus cannabinus]